LLNALTLGASNLTSIQETRFAGFVRNCWNFAENAAQAKPRKKAEVFPAPIGIGARDLPRRLVKPGTGKTSLARVRQPFETRVGEAANDG
jgi:hypothetical protein